MNKKISQFELTNTLYDQDLITVVQSNENKNITVSGLTTSLSNTFSTNDELSTISSKIDSVNIKVENNYINCLKKQINFYPEQYIDQDCILTEVEEFITQE